MNDLQKRPVEVGLLPEITTGRRKIHVSLSQWKSYGITSPCGQSWMIAKAMNVVSRQHAELVTCLHCLHYLEEHKLTLRHQ